jgi:DNA polymerase delta subunit 1
MKFAVKTKKCMSCKTAMANEEEGALCPQCKPQEAKLYLLTTRKVNKFEESFNRLWTQCQRCQGSLHQVKYMISRCRS